MAEKILSQEEIDALQSAISEGKINTDPEQSDAEPVPYDLCAQNTRLRENFDVLEEVFSKFALQLRDTLASKFRTGMDVDYISSKVVLFKDFIRGFNKPTCFHIFNMEPFHGTALLVISDSLVFSFVDTLFGGSGKTKVPARDFTRIEQHMMKKLAADILKNLEKAWETIHYIRILIRKTESNPAFVRYIAPDDLVISTAFVVNGPDYSGDMHICIPYLMLEPIKEKLSYGKLRAVESENMPVFLAESVLGKISANIVAELGTARMTVRELLALHKGDVIKLDTGPRSSIAVKIENVIKYRGQPGTYHGNQAVRITEFCEGKAEGEKNNGKKCKRQFP
ncbi:MAG: flagellar motor switch protein FliM [Desulfococcaceae bacterium]|jgi:flagellar motor switch protein FliM|nr:flagellar motor switch protein FliM [Desulfococcaceae bacterium]